MAKNNNSGKYIKIIVAVALIIAAAFAMYYMFFDKNNDVINDEQKTISQSASASETALSEKPVAAEPSSKATTQTETTKNPETTTKQAKNYELPLSINQALNALEEHYGTEYSINATIEEDGINYFALYKDDEKYASIAVNLLTGEATETITQTNQKTDFYLV